MPLSRDVPVGLDQRTRSSGEGNWQRPSNEYVLNVAFFSFVGFLLVQVVFALIAHSEAMLADCECMMIDALTYLFNLCAERIKNRPLSEEERRMEPIQLNYKREMTRLFLELFPPSISVLSLIVVTIITLREAINTLKQDELEAEGEGVSLTIMLLFSGANLLLDIVNVTCFARANMAFGLDVMRREQFSINESIRETLGCSEQAAHSGPVATEVTNLLLQTDVELEIGPGRALLRDRISSSEFYPSKPHDVVNLNMCSAWTHVCADTFRSIAVLVAAAVASMIPTISPSDADAVAAIVVSVIILGSLLPLLQGLFMTAIEIHNLLRTPPKTNIEDRV